VFEKLNVEKTRNQENCCGSICKAHTWRRAQPELEGVNIFICALEMARFDGETIYKMQKSPAELRQPGIDRWECQRSPTI
jgi:hypothetical protein